MNLADWHQHYYEPQRRSDLIRQAEKRELARHASGEGTEQAPPPPDHASESIVDFVPEELAVDVAQ